MKTSQNTAGPDLIQRMPSLMAGGVFLLTSVFIFIWLFIPSLKEFSALSMKFNTCLGLWLSSISLYILARRRSSPRVASIISSIVLLLGFVTALEYVLGTTIGIDELFVTDFDNHESSLYPGRMSPITAFLFVLSGLGFLLKSLPQSLLTSIGFTFFIPVNFFSFLSIIGYLYGHSPLYQFGRFIRISWQSALCFQALSVGVFFLRHRHVTSILTSRGPGGLIARRLLPTVVLTPILFGYVWVLARRYEIVNREFGVSFFVLMVITILVVVITIIARRLDLLESERQQIAEREALTQKRFLKVMDTSPLIIWTIDTEGRFTLCEGGALKQLGMSGKDFLGMDFYEMNRDNPSVIDHVKRGLRGESFFSETNWGGRIYSSNFSPILDAEGKITGVSAISLDITELRRAESGYLMERVNLRNLFAQTPEIFGIIKGPDYVFEFANESLKKFYGFDPTGKRVLDVRAEAIQSRSVLDDVFETGETYHFSEVPTLLNGETRYLNMTYAARKDQEGNPDGIMFLGLDVTEFVNAREALRSAVSARDEFLSIASHELKTPITSFMLQIQLMDRMKKRQDERTYEAERVNKLIELGGRQLARINRLVEDMLDISRINSGKLSFQMQDDSLSDTVSEVVGRMRPLFDQEGVELTAIETPGLRSKLDRVRIEQVLTNVLTNALRYGEKRPVTLEVKSKDNRAEIIIKDHGRGIKPEFLEKIFNRFERGEANPEVSGLGLGLFISREIVSAHSGTIGAWSAGEGRGTEVRIVLPL